jgi:alpha-tubulin suppressor-like RCC1 family protein
MIAAGYGHTLALTQQGDLYTFGFNIKGQLGVGDRMTRFKPEKLN